MLFDCLARMERSAEFVYNYEPEESSTYAAYSTSIALNKNTTQGQFMVHTKKRIKCKKKRNV